MMDADISNSLITDRSLDLATLEMPLQCVSISFAPFFCLAALPGSKAVTRLAVPDHYAYQELRIG